MLSHEHSDGLIQNIVNMLKINLMMTSNNNTNNSTINIIISIIMISILSLVSNISLHKNMFISKNKFYSYFFKQNKIIIEGKFCFKSTEFITRNETLFSNRFKALFSHIHNNLFNRNIYSLKEYSNESTIYEEGFDNGEDLNTDYSEKVTYIVNQKKQFLITDGIYCSIYINKENVDNDKSKIYTQVENIQIMLYSYTKSLFQIKSFIDDITQKYVLNISKFRSNKLFIYNYEGLNETNQRISSNKDKYLNLKWSEYEFLSTRTFDNIFFDEKQRLLEKLDFFTNNKKWYNDMGCPHTLGIGLSGPPGTGKTSLIKSIANKLGRHLIVIPLHKIKTIRELYDCFFEDKFNTFNKGNSITFNKKIIVFEDIDCMSNIVKERSENCLERNESRERNEGKEHIPTKDIITAVVKGIRDNDSDDFAMINKIDQLNNSICLSDILNLIDGIRETPGRILIITSNYYNKLDKALVRPGRIDITLNMENASKQTISKMYNHFYKKDLSLRKLAQCKDYIVSPAQLFNIRLNSKTSAEFIKSLLELM